MQRPADLLHRKKMSAAWFPYTAVERLWCQLGDMQRAGHSVDQCDRLKKLLHGALMSHLQQVGSAIYECKLHYVARVGADCVLLVLRLQVVVDSGDVLGMEGLSN